MREQHDPIKRAKRERAKAERRELDEISEWHKAEKARIDAAVMSEAERQAANREMLQGYGRRVKRGLDRARRQNTPGALLVREARERLDGGRGHSAR